MRTFLLHLESATQYERISGVVSFVGEDASGSFGVWGGHERMMTSLVFGLARFRLQSASWQFVAAPGALLYFNQNELHLSTRHYLRDEDYHRIREHLEKELRAEEEEVRTLKWEIHTLA